MNSPVPVFLPATADRPVEPAPYVLTDEDMVRLARLDSTGAEKPIETLARYRRMGWLKGTQLGRCIRYLLPDALAFLVKASEENPR